MKDSTKNIMQRYLQTYSFFNDIEAELWKVLEILVKAFGRGGKLLLCGNGGSNADADHIVGELVKGFKKKRSLPKAQIEAINKWGDGQNDIGSKLQQGLPAINLGAQMSVITATVNDIDGDAIFAQQVLAYGSPKDVLLGISTSGNSKNVLYAMEAARQKEMCIIGLTGGKGGAFCGITDCNICVPSNETAEIQEMHTPVYHVLCEMLENEFWDR